MVTALSTTATALLHAIALHKTFQKSYTQTRKIDTTWPAGEARTAGKDAWAWSCPGPRPGRRPPSTVGLPQDRSRAAPERGPAPSPRPHALADPRPTPWRGAPDVATPEHRGPRVLFAQARCPPRPLCAGAVPPRAPRGHGEVRRRGPARGLVGRRRRGRTCRWSGHCRGSRAPGAWR